MLVELNFAAKAGDLIESIERIYHCFAVWYFAVWYFAVWSLRLFFLLVQPR